MWCRRSLPTIPCRSSYRTLKRSSARWTAGIFIAAITSLTPRVLLKNLHRLREVARTCNEFQARRMREHPARFGAFALLPLPDVDGALEEISYALDVLRLDGIGLFSSVNDCYLGDPLFDPVFDELNRRKAVVFIHPTHCEAPEHTRLACAAVRRRIRLRHHASDRQSYLLRHAQALSQYSFHRRARRRHRAVSRAKNRDDGRASRRQGRHRCDSDVALALLRDRQHDFGIRAPIFAGACRSDAHSLGFRLAVRLRRKTAGGSRSLGTL